MRFPTSRSGTHVRVRRSARVHSRRATSRLLPTLVAICAIASVFAPAASATRHKPEGILGSATQPEFAKPGNTAIDGNGDVLVLDLAEHTLRRFHPDGTPANFSALSSTNVIDGHAGDADEVPGLESILGSPNNGNEAGVAVDTSGGVADGDIYVTDVTHHVVDIFSESGKYLGRLSEFAGGQLGEVCGVAVGSNGTIYISDYSNGVEEYVPSANPPTNGDFAQIFGKEQIFGIFLNPGAIAAGRGASASAIFVANFGAGIVAKFNPSTGTSEGNISKEPPSGEAKSLVAVDPVTGFVFYSQESKIFEVNANGSSPEELSRNEAQSEVLGLGANAAGQLYVSRGGESKIEIYGPAPAPPKIEDQYIMSATGTEAVVGARINPEGSATTVQVEYGLTEAYGSITPPTELSGGESPLSVPKALKGLTPGQTYHFRFVATNTNGTTDGLELTFVTPSPQGEADSCTNSTFRTGPASRLADCRAYEMVSPVAKNNVDLTSLPNLGNYLVELEQSNPSGDRLTYATLAGFAEAKSVPYVAQYLASRGPNGWSNQSITSPQGVPIALPGLREDLEFQVFSPDLCTALLNYYSAPALIPGGPEGVDATYRWAGCDGPPQYETVSAIYPTGRPAATQHAPMIQGLSADGRCGLYVPSEFEVTPSLYRVSLFETCAGETRPVNILPDGTESFAAEAGTLGETNEQNWSLREGNYQGAVSTDGSRIYWTASRSSGGPLYLRLNAQSAQSSLGPTNACLEPTKACTIPVSAESAEAYFWAASTDGSRAVYSVSGGASPGLYEFNLETRQSTLLAGGFKGVVGVSKDASRLYFISDESISSSGVSGEPNLYLYDASKSGADRYRFVGTVSPADVANSFGGLGLAKLSTSHRVARVSADGLHAVFTSYAPLTGYDNRDAADGQRDLEVFVYNALGDDGAGSLSCASCNPSGQRPHGAYVEVQLNAEHEQNRAAAFVPPPQTAFYASRAMSDDGRRVFFNSFDPLLPTDTNGREDVYEWEALGGGPAGAECATVSPSFSPTNGGCLSLVSSGESASGSTFSDASPDGRDVFFKTAASLVPQDPGLVDIYDAREGGGFPPPPGRSPACEGEACQGPISPPDDPTPSSATYNGPGNSKHHKKKHHKKKDQNDQGRRARQTNQDMGAVR